MSISSCQLKNPWGFYENLVAHVDQIFTNMFKTPGVKKKKPFTFMNEKEVLSFFTTEKIKQDRCK